MTAATLRAWNEFPIWGAGLGTHEFVFPMFDTSVTPVVAAHADNDYAQLLEEVGLAGAGLLAAFLIGVAVLAVRLARRGRTAVSSAAFGLAFGLIAVSIHSASDFGQRLPANLALSATCCGLLVAISRIEKRDRRARHGTLPDPTPRASWLHRGPAIAMVVGIVATFGWAIRDAYAAHLGERWWAAALALESHIRDNPDQTTDQDYLDLLDAAQHAFESEPNNVVYGYWLNAFRWEPLSRTIDPDTGRIVLHPDVLPFVTRIADELAAVRQIAPTYGPPYALEGQLRLFVLEDTRGAELIRKGARLAAYDPATCLVAGELAAREGNIEVAEPLLTRAVELRPAYFSEVANIYLLEANRPDLARSLAGDDYWRLESLARACDGIERYTALAAELRAEATASLRRQTSAVDATPRELIALAGIDHKQGELESAIGLYRRALGQDYRQITWRLQLARALTATGEVDEAIREVRICLRLRPQFPPAAKLMAELIERREANGN
jgi:tetratricopeptide (TPR) repeat protein